MRNDDRDISGWVRATKRLNKKREDDDPEASFVILSINQIAFEYHPTEDNTVPGFILRQGLINLPDVVRALRKEGYLCCGTTDSITVCMAKWSRGEDPTENELLQCVPGVGTRGKSGRVETGTAISRRKYAELRRTTHVYFPRPGHNDPIFYVSQAVLREGQEGAVKVGNEQVLDSIEAEILSQPQAVSIFATKASRQELDGHRKKIVMELRMSLQPALDELRTNLHAALESLFLPRPPQLPPSQQPGDED